MYFIVSEQKHLILAKESCLENNVIMIVSLTLVLNIQVKFHLEGLGG